MSRPSIDPDRNTRDTEMFADGQPLLPPTVSTTALSKLILRLGIPYALNDTFISASFFVNTLILSQLGSSALAAAGLASSFQLLTIASAKGVLTATSVIVSRNSHTEEAMGAVLSQAWLVAIACTIFITPLFLTSTPSNKFLCIA